mgnify:CR=1 FL=1
MKKLGIGVLIVGIIISIIGVSMKIKERAAIGIIGGADGPTSVFIAGRMGSGLGVLGMIFGLLLLGIGAFLIFRKK